MLLLHCGPAPAVFPLFSFQKLLHLLFPLTGKSRSSVFNSFRYFLMHHLLRKADVMATLCQTAATTAWAHPHSPSFSSPDFICFTTLSLVMYLVVLLLIFCFSYWKVISLTELFMACSWLDLFPMSSAIIILQFPSLVPVPSFPLPEIPFLPMLPVQTSLSSKDKLKCHPLRPFFDYPVACNLSFSKHSYQDSSIFS